MDDDHYDSGSEQYKTIVEKLDDCFRFVNRKKIFRMDKIFLGRANFGGKVGAHSLQTNSFLCMAQEPLANTLIE